MATPIKPTPTIYGADSIRFNKMLAEDANNEVSKEETERIYDLVTRVLANSKLK
jgi:hypothetical protein